MLTGTPSGVGYRRDPKVLLRDGDRSWSRSRGSGGSRTPSPPSEPRRGQRHLRQPRRGRATSRAASGRRASRSAGTSRSRGRCRGCWRLLDEAGPAGDVLRRGPQHRALSRDAARARRRAATRSPATAGATRHWSALDADDERDLLERGVPGMRGARAAARVGFRPPGGELTAGHAGAAARARLHLLLARRRGGRHARRGPGRCRSAGRCSTPSTTCRTSAACASAASARTTRCRRRLRETAARRGARGGRPRRRLPRAALPPVPGRPDERLRGHPRRARARPRARRRGRGALRALPRGGRVAANLGEPLADEPRALDQRAQLRERELAREVLHPAVRADLQPLGRDDASAPPRSAPRPARASRPARPPRSSTPTITVLCAIGSSTAGSSRGWAASIASTSAAQSRELGEERVAGRPVVDDVRVAEARVQRGRARHVPRARGRSPAARTRAPSRRATAATARRSARCRRRRRTGRAPPR